MTGAHFIRTAGTYEPGARTLPREYYTSPAMLEREIEQLFRERWLWVGRAERVSKPGDFFLYEQFGESVIVLRDRAGVLRAFYNVCRHRGTRMCEVASGTLGGSIQCPYHAWTYGLDGRLLGAPHMQDVEGFDKADFPLHPAPVREWEGFVFLSLSRDPVPFETAYAPVLERFARFNLGALVSVEKREYQVAANWKLILQNYNECLHCPTIHPELSKVLPYQSGANDLHAGEQLGGFMELTPGNDSATMDGKACGVPLGDLGPEDMRRAFYYTFFPNMMLSVHPDYVNYYSVWPVDATHSVVVTEWLQHPSSLASGNYTPQGAIDFWDTVNRQDWHICELSQLGVNSRAYTPGPFSPLESIPAAWDRAYLAAFPDTNRSHLTKA